MFRVSVDADDQLRKLSATVRRLSDTDVAGGLQVIGVALLSEIKQDFEKKSKGGTGAGGTRWAPLKPETIKRKNRKGGTKAARASLQSQINVDRGLLRNSATPGFTSAEGGNVLDIDQAGLLVTVGYGIEYAEFVDEKRELIPEELPDDWIETVEDAIEEWGQDILDEELS